jgi:hypothetical protein
MPGHRQEFPHDLRPIRRQRSFSGAVELKFRKIFYRALLLWYLSLDYWAVKLLPQLKGSKINLDSRRIFGERNKAWQKVMGKVFSHCHPICRDCRYFCMIDLPLYQVD